MSCRVISPHSCSCIVLTINRFTFYLSFFQQNDSFPFFIDSRVCCVTMSCTHSIKPFDKYILPKHCITIICLTLVSDTFKAKFHLLKLRCHTQFNVCICAICNLNLRSILLTGSRKVESDLLPGSVSFLRPAIYIYI